MIHNFPLSLLRILTLGLRSSPRFQGSVNWINTASSFHRRLGGAINFAGFSWLFSRKEPTLEEEVTDLMAITNDFIKQGKFPDADRVLHKILLLLSNATVAGLLSHQEFIGRRAHVFSQLAKLRLMQNDYTIAEKLFIQVIGDCIGAGISFNDPMIIELSLKLAIIYARTGDLPKAETGFNFCLMMQKSNVSAFFDERSCESFSTEQINNIALLGMIYNVYAHFVIINDQPINGKNLLESSLKAARKIYPPEHLNCLNLLSDLANVESQLGEYEEARLHLREGIDLANLSITKIPPHILEELSPIFNVLLNFYLQWAVLENCQGCFAEAQRILDIANGLLSDVTKSRVATDISGEKLQEVQTMIDLWSSKCAIADKF